MTSQTSSQKGAASAAPASAFADFELHDILATSLQYMKYETPTPIQAAAIPLALGGKDIMGSAQTGTGKTAAFAIPLVNKLLNSSRGTALVLTPTRELGRQVMEIIKQLVGPKGKINTAFLIGGEPMGGQLSQLRKRPRIVVGTPGRINDHLERGTLMLNEASFLVLDETDRMLDMGFSVQIDQILKYVPAQRQTLMFSATLPDDIIQLSQKYLKNPERVAIGSTHKPAKAIKQEVVHVTDSEKYDTLINHLDKREGSIVVFVKTKHGTERLAKKLYDRGYESEAIHGDLRQRQRDRVIHKFRGKKFRILVATDVIARGLDIPHIAHVINYDLPQVPEDYIHRIGRTARNGAEGEALCLISPQDKLKWQAIAHLLDPENNPKPRPAKKGGSRGRGKTGGFRSRSRNGSGNGATSMKPAGKFQSKGRSFGDKNKRRSGQKRAA